MWIWKKKEKSFRYLSTGTFKQHWAGHLLIKTNFHSFYYWLLIHVPEELISKTVLFIPPFVSDTLSGVIGGLADFLLRGVAELELRGVCISSTGK